MWNVLRVIYQKRWVKKAFNIGINSLFPLGLGTTYSFSENFIWSVFSSQTKILREGNVDQSSMWPKVSIWKKLNMLIPISYMGAILIMSSIPDTSKTPQLLAGTSPNVQNLLHIPVFGLLALLWVLVLRSQGHSEERVFLIAFITSTGYGALIELNQAWVPGRFPSYGDFILDLTGILLFIFLIHWVNLFTSKRKFFHD